MTSLLVPFIPKHSVPLLAVDRPSDRFAAAMRSWVRLATGSEQRAPYIARGDLRPSLAVPPGADLRTVVAVMVERVVGDNFPRLPLRRHISKAPRID